MIEKWETLDIQKIADLKIFDVNKVRRRHPVWKKEGDFVVLESPQWINIIPVTHAHNVVFVEQYRHGIDEITLEVPGGLVERGEDPLDAAERECREETGYEGENHAILLGENLPNPAFLDNKCYSFVWFGCKKIFTQSLDANEDINVVEIPLSDIKKYIEEKKIQHSLVLTAFFYYFIKYGF